MSAHTVFYKKLRSKNFFFYTLCVLCVSLVAVNIFYSQRYNEHMYGVMEGEKSAIISYLKHIWGTPLFNLEVENYQAEGKGDILSEWTNIQQKNAKRIQDLENATHIYSYSPELYYNLHLLYLESGNREKARENLVKAQQIDPSIQ